MRCVWTSRQFETPNGVIGCCRQQPATACAASHLRNRAGFASMRKAARPIAALPDGSGNASLRRVPYPKASLMLDVPTKDQKSYADGKILKTVTEGVGIVTFNNPDKRN